MKWPDNFIDKVICGDCLEVLAEMPDESVDICVTSPPYNQLGRNMARAQGWSTSPGMFKGNKWRKQVTSEVMYEDQMDETEYQSWLNGVLQEMLRVSKGLVWLNHKTRYRNNVAIHPMQFLEGDLYAEVIWNRGGSMALNCKRFAPSHEALYGFGTRHYWNDEANKLMSVWNIGPSRSKSHPCSFPVEIPKRVIMASCPPCGVVLDPFFGEGTTGRAALRTNRHFIGIEIEPKYCEIAEKRIAEERQQLRLL